MSTHQKVQHVYSYPPELPRLRLLDRLALHGGLALVEWAHRARPTAEPTASRRLGPDQQLQAQVAHRELTEARHRLQALG